MKIVKYKILYLKKNMKTNFFEYFGRLAKYLQDIKKRPEMNFFKNMDFFILVQLYTIHFLSEFFDIIFNINISIGIFHFHFGGDS